MTRTLTRTPEQPARARHRVWLALALAVGLAMAFVVPATSSQAQSATGGPVILMGLDSEAGAGGAGHGPPHEHAAMVESLLDSVGNGGEGILVVGPASSSSVHNYWTQDIGAALDVDITFVNGVDNILAQSFDGFAAIAVASSDVQIFSGGLTDQENEALIQRDVDIAAFVNNGGGLIGKTQDRMTNPFGYVGPLGNFEAMTAADGLPQYSQVEITPAGEALGLTQENMSGWCCWHDVFLEFPDFMEVLVINNSSGPGLGEAAAVGGVNVTIPTGIDLEPADAMLEVGETHEVVATVEEDDELAEGVEVTFTVADGPHAGTSGTATTGADGRAAFSYQGEQAGTDTIQASFVDVLDRTRTSNSVSAEWLPARGSLSLSPAEATAQIGDDHSVTATLTDDEGDSPEGAEITFLVADGPHAGETATVETDADGQATFTYEGVDVGTDTIVASHVTGEGDELTSNAAIVEWVEVLAEVADAESAEAVEAEVAEAEPAEAVEAEPDFTG